MFLLFRNQAKAKHASVEFHLVVSVLQKFSFACNQRMSIARKRMLHILRRENKPAALQFTNEQMSRRQSRDLCKVGFAQLTRTADDISVLAGINVSFRPNLKLSGIRSLNPWWMRRRPLCS